MMFYRFNKIKLKKMKIRLLALFALGLNSISMAQSKYGFETGFDSTAFANKISTSTAYEIWIDSLGKRDTVNASILTYNKEGFLIELEEVFYKDNKPQKRQLFLERRVEFEYNESGYLINENYSWFGANGTYGSDTVIKQKTEVWKLVNNSEILDQEIERRDYPDYTIIDSCKYHYAENGQIDKIVYRDYGISAHEEEYFSERITHFVYNEARLLIEENTKFDGVFRRQTKYVYAFFD